MNIRILYRYANCTYIPLTPTLIFRICLYSHLLPLFPPLPLQLPRLVHFVLPATLRRVSYPSRWVRGDRPAPESGEEKRKWSKFPWAHLIMCLSVPMTRAGDPRRSSLDGVCWRYRGEGAPGRDPCAGSQTASHGTAYIPARTSWRCWHSGRIWRCQNSSRVPGRNRWIS